MIKPTLVELVLFSHFEHSRVDYSSGVELDLHYFMYRKIGADQNRRFLSYPILVKDLWQERAWIQWKTHTKYSHANKNRDLNLLPN